MLCSMTKWNISMSDREYIFEFEYNLKHDFSFSSTFIAYEWHLHNIAAVVSIASLTKCSCFSSPKRDFWWPVVSILHPLITKCKVIGINKEKINRLNRNCFWLHKLDLFYASEYIKFILMFFQAQFSSFRINFHFL